MRLQKRVNTRNGGIVWHNGAQAATTQNASLIFDNAEDLVLENNTSDEDIIFNINDNNVSTEVMRVRGATSRVGIGTDLPFTKLHVEATAASGDDEPIARFTVSDNSDGLLQIENRSSTDNQFAPSILAIGTESGQAGLYMRAALADGTIDSGTTPAMTFDARIVGNTAISTRPLYRWRDADGPLMQMDANGNLGIGTTAPDGRLDVNGTVFIADFAAPGGNASDHDIGVDIDNNQLIDFSLSSIYFKENINDLNFDKEAFLNLRPVNYSWKEACGGGTDVGLIAQEVDDTFPTLATHGFKRTYFPDGEMLRDSLGIPVVDSTQTEVRGVRYHKLPVYLLALAKDQQQELNDLRNQVQELTDRIDGCCTSVEPMQRLGGEDETGLMQEKIDEFILLRNDPNPFNDYTDIKYDHEGCGTCEVIITDTSGRIVKRIKVSGASGTVRIFSSELGSGMFVYSLVNDCQIVDSNTMVSSKRN